MDGTANAGVVEKRVAGGALVAGVRGARAVAAADVVAGGVALARLWVESSAVDAA